MGRSAKMMKRPTQKQKQVSKIAKAAAQPLKKREPSPEPVEAPSGGGKKKRKSMRTKADKVSDQRTGCQGFEQVEEDCW